MSENPVALWWQGVRHDPVSSLLGVVSMLAWGFAGVHRMPYFDERPDRGGLRMTTPPPPGWYRTQYLLLLTAVLAALGLVAYGAWKMPSE